MDSNIREELWWDNLHTGLQSARYLGRGAKIVIDLISLTARKF